MGPIVRRKYYYTEAEILVILRTELEFHPEILSPEADLGLRPSMQSLHRLCITTYSRWLNAMIQKIKLPLIHWLSLEINII